MLLQPAVSDARTSSCRGGGGRRSRLLAERGQALLETALTLPLVLLVSISVFEFGRAYQTSQVITNAAREGARVAILPNATAADVQSRVVAYLRSGQLGNPNSATVAVQLNAPMSIGAATASASTVTVSYPFSFMVLNPVANLVVGGPSLGAPITLTSTAQMRNEAQ